MDEADAFRPEAHTFDKVEQIFLIGVGGVAANGAYSQPPWGPYFWMLRPGMTLAW